MAVATDLFQLLRPARWGVIVPDALGSVLEHAVGLPQRISVALIRASDGGVRIRPVGYHEDVAAADLRLVTTASNDQVTRKGGIDAHDRRSIPPVELGCDKFFGTEHDSVSCLLSRIFIS